MTKDEVLAMMELTKDHLKDQADDRRLVTMKAGIMIGIGSFIVTSNLQQLNCLSAIGYFCMFVSMACGLYVIWPKNYFSGPKLDKAKSEIEKYGYTDGLIWIVEANIMT